MPGRGGYDTPTERRQAGLSGPAHARQGMSQDIPGLAQSGQDMEQIAQVLQALRSGQIGAEQMMAFLALLSGGAIPGQGRRPRSAGAQQRQPQRQPQRGQGRRAQAKRRMLQEAQGRARRGGGGGRGGGGLEAMLRQGGRA